MDLNFNTQLGKKKKAGLVSGSRPERKKKETRGGNQRGTYGSGAFSKIKRDGKGKGI